MSKEFSFRKTAEFADHFFYADAHASLKTLWLTLLAFVLERALESRATENAC